MKWGAAELPRCAIEDHGDGILQPLMGVGESPTAPAEATRLWKA